MRTFLVGVAILYSSVAVAGSGNGKLGTVHFMGNGAVIAYTNGGRLDVPACAASQPSRWALDATTPAGRAQLAGLLTAYTSGKTVVIVGTGTCGVWGDTESISYFYTIE